jgi:cation diffusion facilitator CzcD-associated flavoprotein CzcO
VLCVGGLRVPQIPTEFDAFCGPKLHSAQWDKNIELKDKNVAIVGTGGN